VQHFVPYQSVRLFPFGLISELGSAVIIPKHSDPDPFFFFIS
jgi:hypothetical protein